MRGIRVGCFVAVIALSGCSVRYAAHFEAPDGATVAQASVSTGTPLGNAIIIGIMLADGLQYFQLGPDGSTSALRAPRPDPTRAINVQDCTRPVDHSAGNLFCR